MQDNEVKIFPLPFVVDDEPYCVWDPELKLHNRSFIRAIDPAYFEFQAGMLARALEEPKSEQHVAVAARSAYAHALESTLALVFAGLQAPECLFAWMQKYRASDLRSLIGKIESGQAIRNRWKRTPKTWHRIAEIYFTHMPTELRTSEGISVEKSRLVESFGVALRNLAHDFQDEEIAHEYNAMKHGFRVMHGPYSVVMRPETAPGVPDPSAEAIGLVGGASTGASVLEIIPDPSRKWHLRVRQRARNWDVVQSINRLNVAGTWMACAKAGLRAHLGDIDPPPKWQWIADHEFCSSPWQPIAGSGAFSIQLGDFEIPQDTTKEWILRTYDESPPDESSAPAQSSEPPAVI